MEDPDDILARLDSWMKFGSTHGSEIELYYSISEVAETTIENNALKSSTYSQDRGLGIRVVLPQGKVGFVAFNQIQDDQRVKSRILQAIRLARSSSENPFASLPHPREVFLRPSGMGGIDPTAALDSAREVLSYVSSLDRRISIDMGGAYMAAQLDAIVNSNGISVAEASERAGWSVNCLAKDGSTVTPGSSAFDAIIGLKQPENFKLIDIMVSQLLDQLKATKIGQDLPKNVEILLSPETFVDLELASLISAMGGPAVLKKQSPLSREQLGSEIADETITLVDDGKRPRTLGQTAFDREGIPPPKERRVIERGKWQGMFHNQFSSREAGEPESTGHAAGSPWAPPSVGCYNLDVLIENSQDYDEMIGGIRNGLVVNGIAHYADDISGEVQGPIKNSYMIKNGQAFPVKEVSLSGNIYSGLMSVTGSKQKRAIRSSSQELSVPWVKISNFHLL